MLVSMGVVPLIVLAIFYASNRASQVIRSEVEENLALKGTLLAESVTNWKEYNVLALTNLSTQPDIVSMKASEQKPVLTELVKNYKHFYLAMTIGLDGMNLARSDNKKLTYYGDRNYFKGAIAGDEITYQTLISRTLNKPALAISTPIRKNKLIIGIAVIATDLEVLGEQVGKLRFGETGYALVVDNRGQLLAHPDRKLLSSSKPIDLSYEAPIKNILRGGEGQFFFRDKQGKAWVSYGTRLDNGWGILVLQKKSEFNKSNREFQKLAFFIGLISVVGISGVTWILANRLIAPISSLTDATIKIAGGELDRKIRIKRTDELGILASSFDRMASNLKNLFENLEERIEQRTAELTLAKELAEQASAKAENANKVKDRFLANISHELRTPLNSILGYAKILQRDTTLNPSQFQNVRIVQQSGIHLLTLINNILDFLDFSKTGAAKIELHRQPTQLQSFLEEVIAIAKIWATEKGILLNLETIGTLPEFIFTDPTRLRQVLLNLLSNAVKFTISGKVTLKVSLINYVERESEEITQQKLCFEVSDTGVGMNREQLERIFQPFEQLGDFQSRSGGTGLGLSIAKELVELMGGKLNVKSQLGLGSTFWFDGIFPAVEVTSSTQLKIAPEVLGYKGKQRKLLVVDDKHENRQLLVKMLQPIGFEIETAINGEEMLEKAALNPPDLILLDLFMPVKTGFTSAKELRLIPSLQNIPIFIVSASFMSAEVLERLECNAYISKPVDEQKLLALLQEYLHLEWVYRSLA